MSFYKNLIAGKNLKDDSEKYHWSKSWKSSRGTSTKNGRLIFGSNFGRNILSLPVEIKSDLRVKRILKGLHKQVPRCISKRIYEETPITVSGGIPEEMLEELSEEVR